MRAFLISAFALALGTSVLAVPEAQARFAGSKLQAPSLVEEAACVTRRTRTYRPDGTVVVRTVRRCDGPRYTRPRRDCRWVQRPAYRPNGTLFYRTVRVCRR